MVIEARLCDLRELKVGVQVRAGTKSVHCSRLPGRQWRVILELLLLINNLNALLVLLLGRRIANTCKVAVHGHDRWCCGIPRGC